jgi:hypothetical protein
MSITISEIKSRTINKAPYFFDSKTLKFFGQRMGSFKVKKSPAGRVFIYAPIKDSYDTPMGFTFREFVGDELLNVRNEDGSMFHDTMTSASIEWFIHTH